MDTIEKAASDIKKLSESIYIPQHEYRQVDARAFRHIDLNFYDTVRDAFVERGCVWLGDVENLTLKGTANDFRTFIRFLVSEDKTICIGLYHPKPKFWMRMLLWILRVNIGRTIDCETELSPGRYFVTSNAVEAGKLNPPPGFDMKFFSLNTHHGRIFESHCQRVKDFLITNPGIRPIPMRSLADVLTMQHRMQAAKAAYRKGVGYVTEDELKRFGANSGTAAKTNEATDF